MSSRRCSRFLAKTPITIVKKDPIDESVKSLQDQLAAAHAQNERMAETMKEKDAELARVTEEKSARIESLTAEVARLTAEIANALVANARPAAAPTSLVSVAQAAWVTPREYCLKIRDLEVHDNAPMFPKEPPVPCTGADKPIKIELELTNAAGEKVTPPRGFKVQATLHIEGSHSPLTADEVMWAQRGSAPPRRKERLLRLSIGNADNVFEMKESQLALSAHIYPYSSEVQKRKLVIRFTAVNDESVTALSIAVNNMSRTPNSRKNKTPPGLPALTYTGPITAIGTPVVDPSAAAAPPSGLVTPLPALQPVAPGRATSDQIFVQADDDFVNALLSDPEFLSDPPAKRHQIGGASGRDTPLVSVGGVSPEN
jgi:hypothetical protein